MLDFKGLAPVQESQSVPTAPQKAPREVEKILGLLDKVYSLSADINNKVDMIIPPEPEGGNEGKSPEPKYVSELLVSKLHYIIRILGKTNESLSRFV